MQPPRPTSIAHHVLGTHLRDGDSAIDATAGNGFDTVFLASKVGESGRVHAFDIQAEAIANARKRVDSAGLGNRVTWHQADHGLLASLLPSGHFAAVVFNLGYLPGGEHSTTTRTPSTLAAIHAAALCLRPEGLLSVLCYPGHPEGAEESRMIGRLWNIWAAEGWRIACYSLPHTQRPSPVLWLAGKPGRTTGTS